MHIGKQSENGLEPVTNGSDWWRQANGLKNLEAASVKTELSCVVILSRNVKKLSAWYMKTLFLKRFNASQQTTELRNRHGLRLLIADAKTFGSKHVVSRRAGSNPVLLHLKVPDVPKF